MVTVQALIQAYNLFAIEGHRITVEQAGVLTVLLTPLFSYIQNYLESQGTVPEMLKGPAPIPPTDDLTRRELEALATEIGGLHNEMIDLRADRAPAEPVIFTEQTHSRARRHSEPVPEEVPFRG